MNKMLENAGEMLENEQNDRNMGKSIKTNEQNAGKCLKLNKIIET